MRLPLKIGILSFTPLGKKPTVSETLLKHAAKALGHSVRVYRNARMQFTFQGNRPNLLYKSEAFSPPDVMIIRPFVFRDVDLEISTVKHLQLMGIPVVNHYLPIVRAKNKVRTLQILNHHGIPIPKTMVIHSLDYLDRAIDIIGQFPIIMKTPHGTQGRGVSIIESRRSLHSMLDLLAENFKNSLLLIQEYVKEAKGKDIRVFVVGGRVVAAMERKAKRGEFRSNFHRGGSIALTDLSELEIRYAVESAKAIGLDVAGVDIIRTGDGPKVLEVNANPGLEGISKATGVNVAEQIVRFSEKVVKQKKWLIEKENVIVAA